MAIEKLYSVEEAAKALGISYWTIWAKLKNGTLLRTKIGGRTVIRESELQKIIVDQPKPKPRNAK
jgi:excisionase family DNA binding protein